MSSLRNAAALLAGARNYRDLPSLLGPLRFGSPLALDAEGRRGVGLDGSVRRAAVANGAGTLRALLVETAAEASIRAAVTRVAGRVAAHAPQLLWVIILVQPATHALVIAAPAPGARTRISALAIDTRRVADSDGETLAAMADAATGVDLLVHHRWRELLGRDALTRRFYRELEGVVGTLASSARGTASGQTRRELALLCSSRVLFLAFLEAKGWLDGDRAETRCSTPAARTGATCTGACSIRSSSAR